MFIIYIIRRILLQSKTRQINLSKTIIIKRIPCKSNHFQSRILRFDDYNSNKNFNKSPLPIPPPLLIYPHHRHFSRSEYRDTGRKLSVRHVGFLPSHSHRGIAGVDARGRRIGTRHQSKYQRPRALMTVLSLLETSTRTTNLLLAISTRHFTA